MRPSPHLFSLGGLLLSASLPAQAAFDLRVLGRHAFPIMSGTTRSHAIGDVSGDGRPDVYISKGGGGGSDQLLIACSGGGFLEPNSAIQKIGLPSYDAQMVDIDGDDDLDIVTVGFDASSCGTNRVLVNHRGEFFDETLARLQPMSCGRALAVGDVDGDGDPDLFVAGVGANPNRLYLNNAGVFQEVVGRLPPLLVGIQGAVLFDADSDSDLDLALAHADGPAQLLLNERGTFTEQTAFCFPSAVAAASAVAAGDIDGDGDIDLVFSGYQNGSVPRVSQVMRNIAGGCFRQEVLSAVTEDAQDVCLADFDADGDLDLAFACVGPANGPVSPILLVNDGTGQYAASGWRGPVVQASAVGAVDMDSDGDQELFLGGPGYDRWFASYARQLDAPQAPRMGESYQLVISAHDARTTPTLAVLFVASDFRWPRHPLPPFGGVGIQGQLFLHGMVSLSPTGSYEVNTPFGRWNGFLVFQALIVPNGSLAAARLTNVVADSL